MTPLQATAAPHDFSRCLTFGSAVAETIAELAYRILIPLATSIFLFAAFPAPLSQFFVVVGTVGLSASAPFLWQTYRSAAAVSRSFKPMRVTFMERSNPEILPLPEGAPPGIERRGNNCWVNALLHFLFHDPVFMEAVQNPPRNEEGELVPDPLDPLRQFYQRYNGTPRGVSIDSHFEEAPGFHSQQVRCCIAALAPQIPESSGTQQDASEGIAALYQAIPEERLPPILRTGYQVDLGGDPAPEGYPEGWTEKEERFSGLIPLPIVGENPTLTSLVRQYEEVAVQDSSYCLRLQTAEGTKSYPVVREKRTFLEPPRSLTFQLKRFEFSQGPSSPILSLVGSWFGLKIFGPVWSRATKKMTPVEIPLIHSVTVVGRDQPVPYSLDAFIVHRGETPSYGHYVAYVKRGETWYECDDAHVRVVPADRLPLRSAYLVHYSPV